MYRNDCDETISRRMLILAPEDFLEDESGREETAEHGI